MNRNIISIKDNIEIQALILLRINDINKILEDKEYLSPNLIISYVEELEYMKDLLYKLEELYFIEG